MTRRDVRQSSDLRRYWEGEPVTVTERRAVAHVDEAAQTLDLSPATVRRLARSGAIPALKIGGTWAIPTAWLDDLRRGTPPTEGSTPK